MFAQEPTNTVGIDLYEKGDYAGAAAALKKATDPVQLHYLAASLEKLGKQREAGNAFEKSFEASCRELNETVRKKVMAGGSAVKVPFSDFLPGMVLSLAAGIGSAEKAIAHGEEISRNNYLRMCANSMVGSYQLASSGDPIFKSKDLDQRVSYIKKPHAQYPDVSSFKGGWRDGTVKVYIVLGRNGKVLVAVPLTSDQPPYEFEAMKAAFAIEFTPAKKGGKPVTAQAIIEYGFRSGH
jgi:hypothetical protein